MRYSDLEKIISTKKYPKLISLSPLPSIAETGAILMVLKRPENDECLKKKKPLEPFSRKSPKSVF